MSKNLYPGWKMTVPQHGGYWRGVRDVARHLKLPQEEARQMIHQRAFGGPKSAKAINHLRDFDDFLAAVKALLMPTNVAAQMRQAEMPLTRLIYAIRQLAPEAYIVAEAERKFGAGDWEALNESDLTTLRNHLAKRAADIRWPEQAPTRAAGEELVEIEPEAVAADRPF